MAIDSAVEKQAAGYRSVEGWRQAMAYYDAGLERWGVPYETQTVPTRHAATHVITCGEKSAPALALLHGASHNATTWQANVGALSQRFHLIMPDIPGHLGKSEPVHIPLSGVGHAEWLIDVFDAFGLQKPALAGISLGGWISLLTATHAPERIGSLILIASWGAAPISPGFLVRTMLAYAFPTRDNVVMFLRQVSAPGYALDPLTIDTMQCAFKYLRLAPSSMARLDEKKLGKFPGRVLYIVGEQERVFDPQRGVREMKRILPQAQVLTVSNAGHMVSAEQAAIVNKAIIEFLS